MNKLTKPEPRTFDGVVLCPVCKRGDVWQEAVQRTQYVYRGEAVKDGQEVIDYLLAEVRSMLEQAENTKLNGASQESEHHEQT